MGRPKGSKNKASQASKSNTTLNDIVGRLKALGVTSEDLAKRYNKGKPFGKVLLIQLFQKQRAELEKIEVKNQRGRYSGQLRPLRRNELLDEFAKRIAADLGKTSKVSAIISDLQHADAEENLEF